MATYLTPADVAQRWGCSPEHVQRLCKSGALAAMRLEGRGWRIKPEAVADYEWRHSTAIDGATAARTARQLGAATTTNLPPALAVDGDYLMVVPGPVPWRHEVIEAPARPAGRRGGSARTKKAALGR